MLISQLKKVIISKPTKSRSSAPNVEFGASIAITLEGDRAVLIPKAHDCNDSEFLQSARKGNESTETGSLKLDAAA